MLAASQIGGAIVRRRIERATGPHWLPGDRLSGEDVRALPENNRRALLSSGMIEVWPDTSTTDAGLAEAEAKLAEALDCIAGQARELAALRAAASNASAHLVPAGRGGLFDVLVGRKITDAPIPKHDAEALAAGGATKDNQP
jgi:hypothetical protein